MARKTIVKLSGRADFFQSKGYGIVCKIEQLTFTKRILYYEP